MAEQSAKSFLSLLEKSGIVAGGRLKSALAELAGISEGSKVNTKTLTSHLVDSGLITSWHVDKLLNGKYKGFFLGKFKLLGHLGSGGMSSVYLAQHKVSKKKRAIKVLPRKRVSDKSYLERFYREGQAAAALDHPNVVRIYDICSEANTHYMVMEHVQGSDLYEMVKDIGPLGPATAAQYTMQAAGALQHAHDKGMVHRDIKPANLLCTEEGVVKVLDLGLALFQQDEDEESLTVLHNEKVMGTADYLSPEQAVNSHNVDHRADIYSLGCTLYFLLVGKPPFPEGSLAQRIAMHQTQEPKSLLEVRPGLPPELVAICSKMMRKDPDQRYGNCEQLRQTLAGFLAHYSEESLENGTSAEEGRLPFPGVVPSSVNNASGTTNQLATETVAQYRSDNEFSEFAIDTSIGNASKSSSSKSSFSKSNSSKSQSKATSSASSKSSSVLPMAVRAETIVTPRITTRRVKRKSPVWLIVIVISVMVAILVGVLVLASQYV